MLVKKVMRETNDERSHTFVNEILPNALLSNTDILAGGINIKDSLEQEIYKLWDVHCNSNGYSTSIYPDFTFIYTTRLKLNRQKNLTSGIFFLKTPDIDGIDPDDTPISCAILVSENGCTRFFGLKELPEHLLPKRFIKNNQNYLLYELDKESKFTNWGALINTRNLSELSESIFLIGDV